ncbi:MAG: threonine/serine dehydratase [Euryarchaeota archaeon]|nr:threonine/serine dehydratase [Euryarchaeota archaeon]
MAASLLCPSVAASDPSTPATGFKCGTASRTAVSLLPVAFDDVVAAHARIRGLVHRTPVVTSRLLDEATGLSVHLKCENLQRTGSFKFRGASHAVSRLSQEERERGVVTHSSGNHAQALALAARLQGVPATVVMPETASRVKRAATEGYGARVVTCRPTLEARTETTQRVIDETGAVLVHPYDDPRIIAGQGTAALELLEEVPELDVVLAPVGGGGLLSGTSLVAAENDVAVVGCEPLGADDAYRSLTSGDRIETHTPDTIADGLLTTLGEVPFRILSALDVPIVRVDDDEILRAMRFVWERTKLLIEPSSAVPVAALLEKKVELEGKNVGLILSGGNVEVHGFFSGLEQS